MAEKTLKKKKKKSVDSHGVAHIKSTFNNTHVTLTDRFGNVIVWEKAGTSGFRGSRKSTAYAATIAAEKAAQAAMSVGLSSSQKMMPTAAIACCMAALAVERMGNKPIKVDEILDYISQKLEK